MPDNESALPERMRRASIFLDAQSDADIEIIKRCAGLSSASAAIRSALRQQARLMRRTPRQLDGEAEE